MAVTHFEIDGGILCNSKAKTIKSTSVKEDVTCKRCLKMIDPPAKPAPKKVDTVTHFEIDGGTLCNSKAKTIKSTSNKDEVTCKLCLKMIDPPAKKAPKRAATVTHFEIDGGTLCNSKAKTIKSTSVKEDVTCKRCLKKLETPAEKTLSTVSKKKINIKFVEDRKFNFCLKINDDALLKLGDNIDDKIGIMVMFTSAGMSSTSMKFVGPVSQMVSKKYLDFLREWFYNKRNEGGNLNNILVSDCKEAFGS